MTILTVQGSVGVSASGRGLEIRTKFVKVDMFVFNLTHDVCVYIYMYEVFLDRNRDVASQRL